MVDDPPNMLKCAHMKSLFVDSSPFPKPLGGIASLGFLVNLRSLRSHEPFNGFQGENLR